MSPIKKEIEYAVTTGHPLKMSRRYTSYMSPLTLRNEGYVETVKDGSTINYIWTDQFPLPVLWEGSDKPTYYSRGDVIHKQNIKKK